MVHKIDTPNHLDKRRSENRLDRKVIFQSKMHIYGTNAIWMRKKGKTTKDIQAWLKTMNVEIGLTTINEWIKKYG